MRASTSTARIITAVIGLIAAPIGLGLLAEGGGRWQFALVAANSGMDIGGGLAVPLIQMTIGILLLVGVVVTGIWSSAGLLTAGALGLIAIILAIAPALTMGLYRLFANSGTSGWFDALMMGLPLYILPTFGGLGLALMALRRHPAPLPVGGVIGGLIGIPLALLAGGWVLAWGNGVVYRLLAQQLRFEVPPLALLALIGGTLLVVGALAAVRWSPYALVLPAVVLLVFTVLQAAAPQVAFPLLRPLGMDAIGVITQVLTVGVSAALVAIYFAFTATAAIVRHRTVRVVEPAPLP